ncbi:MAG: GerMN domain-containing protein [Bacilli bacterium]|nr:GerMN domain-containing protein [Bacilli bacterium]MBR4672192.1 GerMN domain-containing protein [Bacilli bacterium]
MLKKKALRKIIITTFVLFIVLTICMIPSNKDKIKKEYHYINTKDVSVYLLNESDQLAKVEFKIEDKDIINVVKDIIKKLTISNDATIPNKFRQLIPKNIKLLEVLFDEGMLHLNFSKDFYNIKKDDIEKVVEAISYSLLELSSVNGVSIYVDNENISGYYSNIPEIITKEFGINKRFFIKDLSLVSKVVIYYLDNVDDNYFYVPITKYVSDDRDKIKIIIDELSSNYIYESNLISLLDKNIKLLNYEIVSDTMIIDFNNCIYLGDDKMLEEVIYSVFANYEVNKVIIKANGEEITKKTIKVIE